jgi:hypothetical protein
MKKYFKSLINLKASLFISKWHIDLTKEYHRVAEDLLLYIENILEEEDVKDERTLNTRLSFSNFEECDVLNYSANLANSVLAGLSDPLKEIKQVTDMLAHLKCVAEELKKEREND